MSYQFKYSINRGNVGLRRFKNGFLNVNPLF
jgi:hypothetical protein